MAQTISPFVFLCAASVVCGALAAADWPTFGGDLQRTGWARAEKILSKANVSKLELKWKCQVDNAPRAMNSLTVPVVAEDVFTTRGVKDLIFVAGSSDDIYAIDADTGQVFWQKHFTVKAEPKAEATWLCPNALNATPAVDKKEKTIYLITSDGKLRGLNFVNGEDRFPPTDFVPPFSKSWSLSVVDGVVYTTISQGCGGARSGVAAMNVRDPARPVAKFYSSVGGPGGVWGRAGAAIGANGVVYAETGDGPWDPESGRFGDTVLALKPKDLKLADYYTPANREFITKKDLDMGCISPVVFPYRDWQLVAASGKEGAIFLLDASSLGGADHRTPLFRARYSNDEVQFAGRGVWGSLSTWEDPQGHRWLLAPTLGPPAKDAAPKFKHSYGETPNGSVMAFQVDVEGKKPVLVPTWISRDLGVPEPVVIANGVVLALSSGDNPTQLRDDGTLLSPAERIKAKLGNAVLYALDAETGKELYSSGDTIDSWVHFGGTAVANGRIYISTYDSRVYAFGLNE